MSVHILMYPYPTSGHIIPLLDLAHKLLHLRPSDLAVSVTVTVTVLVTPDNLHLLDPFLSSPSSSPSSLQPLVLPSPEPPATPLPPQRRLAANVRSLRDLHLPLLSRWFESHPSPPCAVVSDFFLGWTHRFARERGVPRVVFSPSGAFALSVSFALWRDLPRPDEESMVSFPKLPNCPRFPWSHIPQIYRNYEAGDPEMELQREGAIGNIQSWGIVINSFDGLDRTYLDHIRKEVGHDRVWAVGPLLPAEAEDSAGPVNRGGPTSVSAGEVLTWLDAFPDESVVYVCFGSRAVLTQRQMDELAAGLERSGVRFILCVREPGRGGGHVAGDCGTVTKDFEDRAVGRGLVIRGWAPQVAILRHRAVGAFLTHCGWNSTLEGLSAGTVMLTWPMGAEQFVNAKLLVDELGVGIRVGEGSEKVPEATELARVLAESLRGDLPQRVRAKEMSSAAWDAIKGGSSDEDLGDFVRRVDEQRRSKIRT
ncbi:flavonol 3-O-glucosyltransferase UGT89B1-like [Rhodamnia argentea]|uniref:Flavonol 3-O-glucosyltransferase UGT89B1-like n=1 Tax=Rhodamnia argentea TaxID=178133 RepID=A0ABM3HI68_9MYRT|nr:flavonol 3-O-glucosyltransferase UGT89B1-like [Rhodamnia argentea]